MVVVEVRQGSVTDADVDVIVNASNTLGQLGSGVSAAVRAACGRGFQEEIERALARERGGAMEPGDVLITHAGAHPRAKFVAHVAVMDYRDDARAVFPNEARVQHGSEKLWAAIEALPAGAYSVGMVALGAGTGSLGERLPTTVGCATLLAHLAARAQSQIARVVFHGYTMMEYVNVLDVVSNNFSVDMSAVDPDVKNFIDELRRR